MYKLPINELRTVSSVHLLLHTEHQYVKMRSAQVLLFLILIEVICCEYVYQQSEYSEPDDFATKLRYSDSDVRNEESRYPGNGLNTVDGSFKHEERKGRNWHPRYNSHNSIHSLPSKLIEEVPNARVILHLSQSSLAALPPNRVLSDLDELFNAHSARTIANRKFSPAKRDIHIDLLHGSANLSVPIDSLDKLIASREFKTNKNVTIFVTGWSSWNAHRENAIYILANAYKCRNGHNFIVVDAGDFVDTIEEWLTLDTETFGNIIGEALAKQISVVPAYRYHLIGHGVGAHIVGAAARRFYDLTGMQIPRVTGLDPARRWSNKIDESWLGLNRGDAEFVDVIHTNNDILGQSNPVGDADFYPNGAISTQPGYADVVSSHYSAVNYFAETVTPGLENSYLAVKGTSLGSVLNHDGIFDDKEKVPMGYNVPFTAKGTYFLETSTEAPHGKNVNYNVQVKCNLY